MFDIKRSWLTYFHLNYANLDTGFIHDVSMLLLYFDLLITRVLTLYAPTPQNGQTHSNNSSII